MKARRGRPAAGGAPPEPGPAADLGRPAVAILGRPNVGKSTLFNRLVGKRAALVDDQPGVTRDLREGAARLAGLSFTVVDTAGLEEAAGESLSARMRALSERAMEAADISLFVMDARDGVTEADKVFADLARRRGGRVLLLANKSEGRLGAAGAMEAYALGLGDPVLVSAEHGEGMAELAAVLGPLLEEAAAARAAALSAAAEAVADAPGPDADAKTEADDPAAADDPDRAVDHAPDGDLDRPMRIAVIGRPNAGKSTLINRILGEERLLTGPEAGITRDSIGVALEWDGRAMTLFDTAGMRRRAKVAEKLEKLSVADGLRAVRFADVVILLMDVAAPFETQDLKLADLAEREGRAVVLAVSKWDAETDRGRRLAEIREQAERLLPQLSGAPLVALSGLTGQGVPRLRDAVLAAYEAWNVRASTAQLNRWLEAQVARHPPPAPSGRRLRLRYLTQAKSRPPTFVLFASRPDALPDSYKRFLVNGLRETFALYGAPIRLLLRASENPFADKAKKRR